MENFVELTVNIFYNINVWKYWATNWKNISYLPNSKTPYVFDISSGPFHGVLAWDQGPSVWFKRFILYIHNFEDFLLWVHIESDIQSLDDMVFAFVSMIRLR